MVLNALFKIRINDIYLKALIDTGSSVNIIHPKFIKRNNILDKKINLKLANGKIMRVWGSISQSVTITNVLDHGIYSVSRGDS
jgi:hypothetical protein